MSAFPGTHDPEDPLAPADVAAAVAPIIDRIRISIARRARSSDEARELVQRQDLPPCHFLTLAMLRHLAPDRAVAIDDILRVFVYGDPAGVRQSVDWLASVGLVEPRGSIVGLTAAGTELLRALYGVMQSIVDELWSSHTSSVAVAAPLVARVTDAASTTGGPAFRVLTPQFVPPGASPAIVLAEELTALRFHRFDAHVDAWQAAGLSAATMQELQPGPQRDAIEADTNSRSSPPYAVLSRPERFRLVAALGALPN